MKIINIPLSKQFDFSVKNKFAAQKALNEIINN